MSRHEQLPAQPAEEHFQIPQKGARALAALLDGNGVRADEIRLVRHDTQVHVVHAHMSVALKSDMTVSQRTGNQPVGKVMPNKEAVMSEATAQAGILAAQADVQQEIGAVVDQKPGKGFGEKPFRFKLSAAHQEYTVVDKCLKCKGATTIPCNTCNASGTAPCTGCAGQGFTQCLTCYGTGQQQRADGSRLPCGKCSGSGRSLCMTCQGAKTLRCAICSGQGRVACSECDRSGSWTYIYEAHWHGEATFELDHRQTSPEVVEVVELLGVQKTATEAHAEILRLTPEAADDRLLLPYAGLLPVARAEFSIGGKACPAVIAGLHGRIIEIEPLLDTLARPGVSALAKLSKGPFATDALIANACRFKMVRQVLAGLAHHGKGHVYHKLLREYPLLISEKFAKATVRYADLALLAISEGPRWKGLAAGAFAAGFLIVTYFHLAPRDALYAWAASAPLSQPALAADFLVWLAACGLAIVTVKLFAARALKKALPQNAQTSARGLPAAGRQGWIALPVTLLLWMIAAFLSSPQPAWLATILQKTGFPF